MSIQDEIFRVEGLQVNEGMAAHFGRTATESLQDAEIRWLLAKAENSGTTDEVIADLWFTFLSVAGFGPGTLNDMKLAYWKAQP